MGARVPPRPQRPGIATPALNPNEIRRRVADARVATLATLEADGRPHLVPVTYALEGDVLYSTVDHKPKTTTALKRLANIRRDSRVAVLVHNYGEDWATLWWCRLSGSASILEDADAARRLLAEKYEQYRERLPSGPVIAVAIENWTGWSFT